MREDMKPKGKTAYQDLRDLQIDVDDLTALLGNLKKILIEVIEKESRDMGAEILEGEAQIVKSKISKIPQRIRFICCNMEFYVDFTVTPVKRDDEIFCKGSIVYGTRREQYGASKNVPEDKPLVEFTINKHGMIESNGSIQGEWWIGKAYNEESQTTEQQESKIRKKQMDHVSDLHFRALNTIWQDAVSWTNETILP